MSGGAKLHMTNSNSSLLTISATLSATPCTLISGCLSYVATLGEAIISRCSPGNCFSTPPLKKKVTWAYFSVSARCAGIGVSDVTNPKAQPRWPSPATWHCLTPCLPSHSARTLSIDIGGKAMSKGNSAL